MARTKKADANETVVMETPVVETPVVEEKAPAAKRTRKTAAKKETAEKETAAKETTKKTTRKTTTRKKAVATNTEVYIQFLGKEVYAKDVVENIKNTWAEENGKTVEEITDLKVYIKPEENKVYYVVNGEMTSAMEL